MTRRKVILTLALFATAAIAGTAGFFLDREMHARRVRKLYSDGYREPFTATYQSTSDKGVTLEFTDQGIVCMRQGSSFIHSGFYGIRRDNVIVGGWMDERDRFYYRISFLEIQESDTKETYVLILK